MNAFSFPLTFPRPDHSAFFRSVIEPEDQLEYAERLKLREDALEQKRRMILQGSKEEDLTTQPGAAAQNGTDSDDGDESNTSSFSVDESDDEADGNEPEEEVEEDIPYDESAGEDMVVNEPAESEPESQDEASSMDMDTEGTSDTTTHEAFVTASSSIISAHMDTNNSQMSTDGNVSSSSVDA